MSIINTGIKNNTKYSEILRSCLGQMSDGIWENTRTMEKYWKSLSVSTSAAGEIVIEDRHGVCADPVDFMANKIKQIIKIEIEDGNDRLSWNRACSGCPSYIGYGAAITVGDCYQLYELLKGRGTEKKGYATYEEYHIVLTCDGASFEFDVEALTPSKAKEQAVAQLVRKLEAKITKK